MMLCPKCKKTEIREEENLAGVIFKREKTITFYCPLCDFKTIKRFKIKEDEYQVLLDKKGGI